MTPPTQRPDETAALTQRAQTLVDLGRPADAVPLLHRALGQAPDDYEALCLLSLAHWNMAQQDVALMWAERAVSARPDGLWAHQLLSCHLLNMGQIARCLSAALEAVRLGPENAKGLKILGRAQLSAGDVAAGEATAQRLLSLAPDSELTYELLTLIAVHEGRWADVEAHCRAALAIEPSAYVSLVYLGQALDKLTPSRSLLWSPGRLPEAVDCLGRAVQGDPAENLARHSLAAALGRYLLSDMIVPLGPITLVLLALAVIGVFLRAAPFTSYWPAWLALAGLFALIGSAALTSRRRFRALPVSTQQFWRQHCLKTMRTRYPWN